MISKYNISTFVLILGLVVGPLNAQDSGFLGIIPFGAGKLTQNQTEALLKTAASRGWNAFDLLNELTADLQTRKIRVEIDGSILRKAGETWRIGDHRVFALLPIMKVLRINLGFTTDTLKLPALEIFLKEPHSDFLELGDFSLQTYYGFRKNLVKSLEDAFGVQVKNGPLSFDLDKILRVPDPTGGVNPNFIAIHIKFFFRPKQWHIDPIRLWAPGEDHNNPS